MIRLWDRCPACQPHREHFKSALLGRPAARLDQAALSRPSLLPSPRQCWGERRGAGSPTARRDSATIVGRRGERSTQLSRTGHHAVTAFHEAEENDLTGGRDQAPRDMLGRGGRFAAHRAARCALRADRGCRTGATGLCARRAGVSPFGSAEKPPITGLGLPTRTCPPFQIPHAAASGTGLAISGFESDSFCPGPPVICRRSGQLRRPLLMHWQPSGILSRH